MTTIDTDARALLIRFAGRPLCEAYHDLADDGVPEDEPLSDDHYGGAVDEAESDLRDALGACGFDADQDANDPLPTREALGLEADHCEACGRRRSWGCGHEPEHEAEAYAHAQTVEHKSGACMHYGHADCSPDHCPHAGERVPGYVAFVTHRQQAIRYGAADPKTGEPFTSAQRQAWIDTGSIPDVADTFPT